MQLWIVQFYRKYRNTIISYCYLVIFLVYFHETDLNAILSLVHDFMTWLSLSQIFVRGGGGGLQYETDGDARHLA